MIVELSDVTDRIVTLMKEVEGITTVDKKFPVMLYPANLPFCFVEPGGATYAPNSSDFVSITRDWLCLLYIKEFQEGDKQAEDAAYEACMPFLERVPQFFWRRKRLEYNDSGLDGIDSAQIARDDGVQSISRLKGTNYLYYGIAFRLSVMYTESVQW